MRTYFKSAESQAKAKIVAKSRRKAEIQAKRKYLDRLLKPQVKELMAKDLAVKKAVFNAEVKELQRKVSTEEIIKFVISKQ
jgi:hypothetical protein